MIYLIEVLCPATYEVWYGCRSETAHAFTTRLRHPSGDTLGRWIKQHGGIANFKLTIIAKYGNQGPAVGHANKLIMRATAQGRSANSGPLSISDKRNAPS